MTKEEVLKQVEQRLGALNHDARCAVEVAVEVMTAASNNATTRQPPLPPFEGSNPSWEEMTRLSLEERSRIMQELEECNKAWLEAKCQDLGAMWLLVVDGQILRWGASLASFVTDEEKAEIGERTGKFPLYYEADWSLMIEEINWHPTNYPGDAYPTLAIQFASSSAVADTVAGFDTGGMETYADAAPLQARGVVTVGVGDVERSAVHLGSPYRYLPKPIEVRLLAADGRQRAALRTVRCVLDWHNSPFVIINLNRVALVGRLTCLDLQPIVCLDFAQQQTTVQF